MEKRSDARSVRVASAQTTSTDVDAMRCDSAAASIGSISTATSRRRVRGEEIGHETRSRSDLEDVAGQVAGGDDPRQDLGLEVAMPVGAGEQLEVAVVHAG